jgi:S1-C subfamily serine protease
MLSLVASLLLFGQVIPQERTLAEPQNLQPVGAYQNAAWASVVDSLALMPDLAGKPFGLAILIDERGYFLAHGSSVMAPRLVAKLSGGQELELRQISHDKETSMVLLAAEKWDSGKRRPVKVSLESKPGEMMVATSGGPVRGMLTSNTRPGLLLPSQRYVPLAEVQFETKDVPVGGAIVFDNSGRLVGVIGAILQPVSPQGLTTTNSTQPASRGAFGPQGLTVAYALGNKIVNRVVEGFRRDGHQVDHPSVGMFFRAGDVPGQIFVDSITPGSPSDVAGLKVDDQIVMANGTPVGSVIDFAALLFELQPGSELKLKVYRKSQFVDLTMKVAVKGEPVIQFSHL